MESLSSTGDNSRATSLVLMSLAADREMHTWTRSDRVDQEPERMYEEVDLFLDVVRAHSRGVVLGELKLLTRARHTTISIQRPMAQNIFGRLFRPPGTSLDLSGYVCHSCKRQQSSYRRTRKALRVKPDPSFQPATTETQDHIIYNPPSSVPSVYHTPQKFLPKTDPRRKIHTATPITAAATQPPSTSTSRLLPQRFATKQPLPEPVRPIYQKKYHVTPEQVEEICELRKKDPKHWTRLRLAEKFGCSEFFIGLCFSSMPENATPPALAAKIQADLETIKSKWGPRKREARQMRSERKKLWGRDA